MRTTLKEIKNYVLPSTKELPHEDVIPNIVAEREAVDKLAKLDDFLRVEREMKRVDPNFKGFYMLDIPYPYRIRKIVTEHAKIMVQMLEGPIGKEEMVCLNSPEPDLVPKIEQDEPAEASWVTKGNKRQNIVHIPIEVK